MVADSSREYPRYPIPAVGALIFEDDRLLLIKRGRPPAEGQWTLPGGVIEPGESPEEAIVREVREECGLDIVVEALSELIDHVVKDKLGRIQYHYLILDYLASCRSEFSCQKAQLKAGSDVTDARWVPLNALRAYELTSGLLPVIEKAAALRDAGNAESQEKKTKGEIL
ncbi:hypothetical protein CSB45_05215 [candidate division KSB3 bacterium]|uniref:Nudix hydrolase domain-containing protein n=1 Tax=candidate division KSB3 bacterium TaxID=2044937 RepID=A0A2G6E7M2_9BACT|nr:MAG: hypothetical protein CSB45_05215 [candidate division KSB3 bacterium]PIE30451.1 MAG: hypothetical protein CSA57_03980 [candidate division KSB3 bacterium]